MTTLEETPGRVEIQLDEQVTYLRSFGTRITWVYFIAATIFHLVMLEALAGVVFGVASIALVRAMVWVYTALTKSSRAPIWYVAVAGASAGAIQASYLIGRLYLPVYFWSLMVFACVLFALLAVAVQLSVPKGATATMLVKEKPRRVRRSAWLAFVIVPAVTTTVLFAYIAWTVLFLSFLSISSTTNAIAIGGFYVVFALFTIPLSLILGAVIFGISIWLPKLGQPGWLKSKWLLLLGAILTLAFIIVLVLTYVFSSVSAWIAAVPNDSTWITVLYSILAVMNTLGGIYILMYDTRYRIKLSEHKSAEALRMPVIILAVVTLIVGIGAGVLTSQTRDENLTARFVAPLAAGLHQQPDDLKELPVSFFCFGSDIFTPTCPAVSATWHTHKPLTDAQVKQLLKAIPGKPIFPTDAVDKCGYRDEDNAAFCRINGTYKTYYYEFTQADYGGTNDFVIDFIMSESDGQGIQCELDNNCDLG
jgi:hypothetical protein